jgi:hypothetical protein
MRHIKEPNVQRHGSLLTCIALGTVLSACHRPFVPAPAGTPLDEICNPINGVIAGAADTLQFGPALIPVSKGWVTSSYLPNDLTLSRIDAELNVWRGARFVFPALEPRNAVRCSLQKGDTTISIQATRLEGFKYRVDVSWEPLIGGQYFYMQLQTRYVAHLRQMRGTIESLRFAVDTVRGGAAVRRSQRADSRE